MAEVFEAEALGEAGFVRRVAIKRMLGTANEDPSFARMFLDEARIASRLHHANIVSVLDYGVVDGAPFQVLELVDGVDGRALIRRSAGVNVPVDVALYLVTQIGHALSGAHDAVDAAGEALGIVHRDVSPGNVLVSWDGDVKLADFGIAFAKDKTEKTEAGTTKGTLVYMSPEQVVTGRVDCRADVFSLGCVLHALLTGVSPLADDGITQLLAEQRVSLAPGLPEDVRSIIEIATQYDREQRFQSAAAMTEAVGRALASRIDREPRRRLVEYLAPLRGKPDAPQGRLDALLRVDIVLAQSDPTVREFHAMALDGREEMVAPPRRLPGPQPSVPSLPAPSAFGRARRSRAGAWLAALGAVVVLGVAGTQLRRGREVLAAAPSPEAVAVPSASSASVVVATPSASLEATPVLAVTPMASAATRKAPPLARAAPSAAPSAASPAKCLGTIYLSCPLAPRASIAIDGALTSYHHGDFVDLGCARHTVNFQSSDGRSVGRSVAPTSANTRTSPLETRCGLN